jgi:hypothetical protein
MHFDQTAFAFPFVSENAEEGSSSFWPAGNESSVNSDPATIAGRFNFVSVAFVPNCSDRAVSAGPKKDTRSSEALSLGDQQFRSHVTFGVVDIVTGC